MDAFRCLGSEKAWHLGSCLGWWSVSIRRGLLMFSSVLLLFFAPTCSASPDDETTEITLWMMPIEQAANGGGSAAPDDPLQRELAMSNFGMDDPVTVVNYTDAALKSQLDDWNPDLGTTMFKAIYGHHNGYRDNKGLLSLLEEFATDHNTHVYVRFLVWGQAFEEIQKGIEATRTRRKETQRWEKPDVVQVGSTWVERFAKNKMLVPAANTNELEWRSVPSQRNASLRYTIDVRLLFYWKRLPNGGSDPGNPLKLDCNNWTDLVNSLTNWIAVNRRHGHSIPPVVMPIGPTLNVLHDYAPLVWSGGGRFWGEGRLGPKVDLTSDQALSVPLLLARNATYRSTNGIERSVIAFPEKSHQDVRETFFTGRYLATIELPLFLLEWRDSFTNTKKRTDHRFSDCAAVAVPPKTFKGGSDLMVAASTPVPDLAFKLARFMVGAQKNQRPFGRINWHQLPAQAPPDLLAKLFEGSTRNADIPTNFMPSLTMAMKDVKDEGRSQEYPYYSHFPTKVECQPVRWALQGLWREMARHKDDPASDARVRDAAREAEIEINRRINRWTALGLAAKRWWPVLLVPLLVWLLREALVYVSRKKMAHNLDRLRGFAFTGLADLASAHGPISSPFLRKRKAILNSLDAYCRSQSPDSWQDESLRDVVGRAIVSALFRQLAGDGFEKSSQYDFVASWEDKDKPDPVMFVGDRLELTDLGELIQTDIPPNVRVRAPCLIEGAITCIVENAYQAAIKQRPKGFIKIVYDRASRKLDVENPGSFSGAVTELINSCSVINRNWKAIEAFTHGTRRLLADTPANKRPPVGIGLVQAFLIITALYGRLFVEPREGGHTALCTVLRRSVVR